MPKNWNSIKTYKGPPIQPMLPKSVKDKYISKEDEEAMTSMQLIQKYSKFAKDHQEELRQSRSGNVVRKTNLLNRNKLSTAMPPIEEAEGKEGKSPVKVTSETPIKTPIKVAPTPTKAAPFETKKPAKQQPPV